MKRSVHAIRSGALCIVSLWLLLPAEAARGQESDEKRAGGIERIYLIHLSHTDYGFTDSPAVCREMQRRYLDVALDGVLATRGLPEDRRFRWTAETTAAVLDWWQAAGPERRRQFLDAVSAGDIEVAALPINNTPFLSREEWVRLLRWLPEDLWQALKPKVAVQNDVNGFPRAGAMALLDRGIRYLFTGINADSGGPPFHRPSAFWWRMPDGRRLLVYLNYSYPAGYEFFAPREWRQGPLPRAADTRYRPPRPGDMLRADEPSLREAHRHCLERVRAIEAEGYPGRTLVLSITNQWRIDNDPPFPPLAEFVASWNRLGLKPELKLTTPSVAMERMEKELGDGSPEHAGEWTDWWANGSASTPRELAASRLAKRHLRAAASPVWGEMDAGFQEITANILKDICLFDEHTWGSGSSVAFPDSLDSLGQWTEKSILACRPMALSEWVLSQRVRTKLRREGEGMFVANAAQLPVSGWVRLPVSCFRQAYRSVEDPGTGARLPLVLEKGVRPWTRPGSPQEMSRENLAGTFPDEVPDQVAAFWVENLAADSIWRLRLGATPCEEGPSAAPSGRWPAIVLDDRGWPASVAWEGMKKPLFLPGLGDFVSVESDAFAARWENMEIWTIQDEAQRRKARTERLVEKRAAPEGRARRVDTAHTMRFQQPLVHPRLAWATREIEIWRREPRARLTIRFHRTSSVAPEIFYVTFPFPCEGKLPRLSCGGEPFTPFVDQLPGSCRDHFAVDGWAHYGTSDGHWIWVSRDAPLISFGEPQALARIQEPPAEPHRILAMVYNNFWYTNFAGDQHGTMEFQFEMAWRDSVAGESQVAEIAEALASDPVVFIQPALPESEVMIERLWRP